MVIFILIASVPVLGAQDANNEINWPSFRGVNAKGFSDGHPTPVTWNVENGDNIEWKTAIPGLAHSSLNSSFRLNSSFQPKYVRYLKNSLRKLPHRSGIAPYPQPCSRTGFEHLLSAF